MYERLPIPPSTAIASLEYDTERRSLLVELQDGQIIEYADVPETTVNAFRAAPSLGGFFNQFIRPIFRSQRVG